MIIKTETLHSHNSFSNIIQSLGFQIQKMNLGKSKFLNGL